MAGSIISKFSSQPVTAVDNEDDEDTVLMMKGVELGEKK